MRFVAFRLLKAIPNPMRLRSAAGVGLVLAGLCLILNAVAQEKGDAPSQTIPEVTVGMSGKFEQIVLPGTELVPKKVDPRATPVAIRIDDVFPHGDRFRYDMTWFGLEPGEHNLVDYLERKDGSATDEIPAITVRVNSVLPPDRLKPNEASEGFLASVGGYQTALIIAGLVWLAGLIVILNLGRGKDASLAVDTAEVQLSEVDRIQQLLLTAIESGELSAEDKAELDTGIFNFWRKQRSLESESMESVIAVLREDEEAGPLLQGIERWFYSTRPPGAEEIRDLLEPMRQSLEQPGTLDSVESESQAEDTGSPAETPEAVSAEEAS